MRVTALAAAAANRTDLRFDCRTTAAAWLKSSCWCFNTPVYESQAAYSEVVRILLITCIGSCALLTAALASAEPHWAELNREARQAITANDYPKLYATLAQLAPLMPGNVGCRFDRQQ